MIKIAPKQAVKDITRVMKAGLVAMLAGDPGVGKSSIVLQIAAIWNLKVIDIRLAQCDPTDLNGFPHIGEQDIPNPDYIEWLEENPEPAAGKMEWRKSAPPVTIIQKFATYIPMDTFPLENTPLPLNGKFDEDGTPQTYDGWILFFDEFNSAPLAVQAASYKIVLDKAVGQNKIHKRAAMVCAGNLITNNAIVNRLSTAMQTRLIHLNLATSLPDWVDWASKNKLDHRVISYLETQPANLHNFKPDHTDCTFACPRTWEFTSQLIINNTDPLQEYMALLAGTISESIAREFVAYSGMYNELPSVEEIKKTPLVTKVPTDPSQLYAVAHMIAAGSSKVNIPMFMEYINRMPIEFQTITLQNVIHRDQAIIDVPCVEDWVTEKGMQLYL